jgi:hypothetical protein
MCIYQLVWLFNDQFFGWKQGWSDDWRVVGVREDIARSAV